jgi:phosphatidylglycerophosphatase C
MSAPRRGRSLYARRVQTETVAGVLSRLEVLTLKRPGGVLAFDADGTLWSGDVGDDFFRGALAERRFERPAVDAIRSLAIEFGVETPEESVALAAAVYDAYLRGEVPEDRICEMVAFVCAGWSQEDVTRFAARVARDGKLTERLHAETIAVLEWARARKVEAFVVSASPLPIVVEGTRPLGFDRDHVVAVTSIEEGGVVSATVERPIPYAAGKVTRLFERIGSRPLYAAFGDNVFDIPLLGSAELAVAVRPKPRLMDRASEVPGLVRMR